MAYPNIARKQPGGFGTERLLSFVVVGTGGLAVGNTTTTSYIIPLPRAKVEIAAVSINALVAAASAGTVTAQLFKRNNQPASPADVTLTSTLSLKSDVVTTLQWVYAFPLLTTSATLVQDRTFQLNDFLRLDVVASGTVTTQPTITVTLRYDALT